MANAVDITTRDSGQTEITMQDVAAAADEAARRLLAMAATASQRGIVALVALQAIETAFAEAVRQ